jgi:hypothetical protein
MLGQRVDKSAPYLQSDGRLNSAMSRRPAQITQAEVRRIVRAAKQEGASEVIVQIGEAKVLIRLSTVEQKAVDAETEAVL